jgi:asparagine synthase (glutamine-hydrolysing)
MCGICGVVSRDDPVDRALLDSMSSSLFHRGPDSGGIELRDGVGLAARRLAIIDLETGDQPLTNEDGSVVVVQNGEIYNYRELRSRLQRAGHTFSTKGDTEVLAHLYEERGPRFAEELRGMFAVAVWDASRRRLVLARDRYGIKPLYYRSAAGTLSFASELKALLRQPGFSRAVDPAALELFLAFSFVPAPLSIFSEVRKLPPGSVLVWEQDGTAEPWVERYARPRPVAAGETRREHEAELAEELLQRLRDSVRAHLIADVPVGVLLSGGIDSCTLAALASETAGRVSTFTIGYDERAFDERPLARILAERYGTDHHELVVRPDAARLLPALTEAFDEPFADSSAIPTYLVSQLARTHVKVALSGEGGDELFGGYNYYTGHVLAQRLAPTAALLRPFVERMPTSTRGASSLDWRAKRWVRAARLSPLERHHAWKSVFTPEERAALRRGWDPPVNPLGLLRDHYAETEGADELGRLMGLDMAVFMVDDMLTKTDRASMAHSLEARVPILDPVVAELALALPSRLKVRGMEKKRLLRRAVAPLLPREILEGKKRGFSAPIGAWLRGELQPLTREVLSASSLERQGFFDPGVVAQLLDDHVAARADNSRKIWALLTFSLWFEHYVSTPVGSTHPVAGGA